MNGRQEHAKAHFNEAQSFTLWHVQYSTTFVPQVKYMNDEKYYTGCPG
jgi:hypothetical protein